MAAPRKTIWELESHTRAKHELLKRYLQAWMIILSQGNFAEILYIDGFAEPGEYAGGEAGSPIIALDTALEYKSPLTAKVHFLFIEKDDARGSVGIGFAVPSSTAKNVVAQLREHGHVTRGWLGVAVQSITPTIAKSLGLDPDQPTGALVASVTPNSPAAKAGIKQGDVMLSANGHPIKPCTTSRGSSPRRPLGRNST